MTGIRAWVAQALASPAVGIEALTGGGGVLVLAPHPDDESLGCGAAIAAATQAGCVVTVVVVTDGGGSHPGSVSHPPERLATLRAQEVGAAVAILTGAAAEPILLGYADQDAPDDPARLAAIADRLGPQLRGVTAIWTTWAGDPHPDHQRTWTIARHLAAASGARLLAFPIWGRVQGAAEVAPGTRVLRFETAPWRAVKARAIAAHRSQMTGLIADDPGGFRMPPDLARHFAESDEIFLEEGG